MNPHNFSIYACEVCGIALVCGAIWLLKTGAIKLTAAARGGKLDLEISRNVKISTTYPALGLFVIGLAFCAVGVWFSQGDISKSEDQPLAILGTIHGVDDAGLVTVTVEPDQFGSAVSFGPDSSGQLDKTLPDIKQLRIKIVANGYRPQPYQKTLNVDSAVEMGGRRVLTVPDEVKFTKIENDAAPPPGRIETVPPGVTLPPLKQ